MAAADTALKPVQPLGAANPPAVVAERRSYFFGPFHLQPDQQTLWEGERKVRLGNRAITILAALAARAGELVTKQELVRIVWPQTFVEEVNLRVHIAAVRRALGDDRDHPRYVTNIAGRGYRFIAPVTMATDAAGPADPWGILLTDGRPDLAGLRGQNLVTADPVAPSVLSSGAIDALPTLEGLVLSRLSMFAGDFTFDAAAALACDQALSQQQLAESLRALIDRSLLASSMSATGPRLSIPLPVRVLVQMHAPDETRRLAGDHAELMLRLIRSAATDRSALPYRAWAARYEIWAGDIDAALSHLQANGPASSYAELACRALPLAIGTTRAEAVAAHARHALDHLATAETEVAVRLALSLASFEQARTGPGHASVAHIEQAGRMAGDRPALRASALIARVWSAIAHNDPVAASDVAQDLRELDDVPRALALVREAALASAEHYRGNHARARQLALHVARAGDTGIVAPDDASGLDQRVSMRIVLTRDLWITGHPEQALQASVEALEFAEDEGALALCTTLAAAVCPVLLWCGDDAGAARHIQRLAQEASRADLPHYLQWSKAYDMVMGVLAAKEGRANRSGLLRPKLTGAQDELVATLTGEPSDNVADWFADGVGQSWCMPELVRLEGVRMLMSGVADANMLARRFFRDALDLARRQGALAWELRAAMSLARIPATSKDDDGLAELAAVYGRFAEGHATSDLIVARALLRMPRPTLQGAPDRPLPT